MNGQQALWRLSPGWCQAAFVAAPVALVTCATALVAPT